MKKIIVILAILGVYTTAFAATATSSSATVASSPAKSAKAAPQASSDQAVVLVSVPDCLAGTPCFVIKTSAEKLSQAVNQNSVDKLSDKQVVTMIQNSILPQIDFNLMTKYVMGPAWKQANSEQQTQITNLFKQLLIYQYSTALSKFKGAQVSVDSSAISGDKQNRAAIKGTFKLPSNGKSSNQPVNIEYDLAKIGTDWKIYDVKIENVSIVTTYRSQFNETVQNGGAGELIKQLQAKIDNITSKN